MAVAGDPPWVSTRSGADLQFGDGWVMKRHRIGTDVEQLSRRMAFAVASSTFVPPVLPGPVVRAGRPLTVWPLVEVVDPDADPLPWTQAGALLARLHETPPTPDLPRHGWSARLARAAARAPVPLADLGRRLVAQADRPEAVRVLHGDWHLGQLGGWDDGWRLLDVDDLGVGDPAWDLARPAGFWAAGLLPEAGWDAFLTGYRDAGGPAVPANGDPWPALDLPARCAIFVAAVREVSAPSPDQYLAAVLVEACHAMP